LGFPWYLPYIPHLISGSGSNSRRNAMQNSRKPCGTIALAINLKKKNNKNGTTYSYLSTVLAHATNS
jgi:hypothetical protein